MIDHSPYTRTGTGPNAVLLLHGIAGSPGHFRDLVPVIPAEFSVYNILLDGHSGKTENFSRSSMAKWKAQVAATLADLFARHEKVVIVAHSMGTLFAIQSAIDHPDKIPALFLLAAPLKLFLKPKMAINAFKVYFDKISPYDHEALAAKKCYGIGKDKNPLNYIGWIPRFPPELLRNPKPST